MSSLESVILELKALPPAQFEQAASYIRHLRNALSARFTNQFRQTSGVITAEEANTWLEAIEDCERVDESNW